MDTKKIGELLKQNPMAMVGFNGSGLPSGDDDGYDVHPADENQEVSGQYDDLVEITGLPTRGMYYNMGFTKEARMFLRTPALNHYRELDEKLNAFLGWKLQVADPFRPWTVQRKGHIWGVEEVARNEYRLSIDDVRGMMRQAMDNRLLPNDLSILTDIVLKGDRFFSKVGLLGQRPDGFATHVEDRIIVSAANLGAIDLPLDPYAQTAHSTGGVADCEPIDAATGKKIFMGTPVDTQGLIAATGFFEPTLQAILEEPLIKAGLTSLAKRMTYYREEVRTRPTIQAYFEECGIHLHHFLGNDEYFDEIWNVAQANLRGWVAVLGLVGVEVYGLEWWHLDANDARGGVRSQRLHIVSGGPSYAIYKGQPMCAWGNATRLYDRLIAA